MNRFIVMMLVATMVVATGFSGCETTGQGAGLGAGLGAAAGAIIGHQSGRALEGAAIGAALGAAAGAVASKIRQNRIATRAELERQYLDAGQPIPANGIAKVREFNALPQQVSYDQPLDCRGNYEVLGAANPNQRYGEIRIYNASTGNNLLKPTKFNIPDEGVHNFATDVTFPDDALEGEYIVELTIVNGEVQTIEERRVSIV